MVVLADLLLHQAERTHDVPPYRRFQARRNAGFVVDEFHALGGEVSRCLPDGRIIIYRAAGHLFKGVIHALAVGVAQRIHIAVRVNHAEGLREVLKRALRPCNRGTK